MTTAERARCRRGKDCMAAGEVDSSTLCPSCYREVDSAVRQLTADYVELGALVAVTSQAGDGVMVAGSRELKVPVRLDVMSLQHAIDVELSQWAEPVAEAVRVDWDTRWMSMTRPGYRVQQAARILYLALDVLVDLGPLDVLAWSPYGIVATTRDGADGALGLLELHRQATWVTFGDSGDVRVPTPCPRCESRALVRPNGSEHVACRACGAAFAETDYDTLCLVLVNEFGARQ